MTTRSRILVVDDEATMREVLRTRLSAWGFNVDLAGDAREAAALLEKTDPAVIISDVVFPDANGVDLLDLFLGEEKDRPVILITAFGTVDAAVNAMKRGARDFLTKPLDYRKLKSLLDAFTEESRQRRETRRLESSAKQSGLRSLLGVTPKMRELFELAKRVAASDASALITGESGTGKEVLARTIHELSPRHARPFVAINSAAVPDGLIESELFGHERGAFTGAIAARAGVFEQAEGGTLLLDEIAEMPVALQPKLLRVLEQREVRRVGGVRDIPLDVRVIAATNQDPLRAVSDGTLRRDLYYRLNVFILHIPPLRERAGDLPLLAQRFVQIYAERHGLPVDGLDARALEVLRAFSWPGNVRELRNVIERAVILTRRGWIGVEQIPQYVQEPPAAMQGEFVLPADVTAAEAERVLIMETLQRSGYNKAEAARRLGIDVKTIRNKLHSYGMKVTRP